MCPMAGAWQRNRKAKGGKKDQGLPDQRELCAGVEFLDWLEGEMRRNRRAYWD
jgi:hypothetical protein